MNRVDQSTCWTFSLIICFSFGAKANNIKIAYVDSPPYAYLNSDNKESGLLIDVIREMMLHLNIEAEFIHLPHRRKIDFINQRKVDLWAGQRNSQVNNQLIYISKSPLFLMELRAYWQTGTEPVVGFNDLTGKNLILISSYSYGGNYTMLNKNSKSMTFAISHDDAFNKLFSIKNSYLLGYNTIAKEFIKKFHISNVQNATLTRYNLYLKLSRSYPDAINIMKEIDNFLPNRASN